MQVIQKFESTLIFLKNGSPHVADKDFQSFPNGGFSWLNSTFTIFPKNYCFPRRLI